MPPSDRHGAHRLWGPLIAVATLLVLAVGPSRLNASSSAWAEPVTEPATASLIAQLPDHGWPGASASTLIEVPALDATLSLEATPEATPDPSFSPSPSPSPSPTPRRTPAPTPIPTKTLVLLHTNDTFGLLDPVMLDPYGAQPTSAGGLTRLAAQLALERSRRDPTLLVSAGNVLGPGSLAASSHGHSVIAAMNQLGYDVWMPANHDFNYGLDALSDRIRESSASVVLTNVTWKSGRPLAQPWVVLERHGLRVGFIGLVETSVTRYLDFGELDQVSVTPPLEAAAKWVPIMRAAASPDIVVALTHLALDQEMPLLTRSSGVDLVIGGFNSAQPTAIAVHEVLGIDGKRALHAGGYGTALGRARLVFRANASGSFQFGSVDPSLLRLDDARWSRAEADKAAGPFAEALNRFKTEATDDWQERFGALARIAPGMDTDQVLSLVPRILREEARSELAIVPRSFFHSERVFGPIASVRSLYWAMPWEDALVVAQVPGDKLAACYQLATQTSPPDAFFAGVDSTPAGLRVNGHPLDPKAIYSVATTLPTALGKHSGFATLQGVPYAARPISVRRAVVRFFTHKAETISEVSSASFSDYSQIPFWKSSLSLTTDMQSRSVTSQGTRYPDLAWRTDKGGMSWGGDLGYRLAAVWGPHDLSHAVNLSYHSDTLANGQSQVSNDKMQYVGDYRADPFDSLLRPYTTLTLNSRFYTPPGATPYFLGQLGTGFSHELPWGTELREGVEYRHHFLDATQPDKTGLSLQLSLRNTVWLVAIASDLKVFATPQLDADGVTIDSQNVFTLPLTDVTALSYRADFFRNTRYVDWASRTLIGLSFKFNQPFLF